MKKVEALFIDVDGTLTDGKINIGTNGELFKSFDVKDGYAIKHLLPDNGITPVIITGRQSPIVEYRCMELGVVHVYQNCNDKVKTLNLVAKELKITKDDGKYNAAYIGDDIVDLDCMKKCSVVGCPSDAIEDVKKISDFISNKKGGDGAVREFIEWLLQQ